MGEWRRLTGREVPHWRRFRSDGHQLIAYPVVGDGWAWLGRTSDGRHAIAGFKPTLAEAKAAADADLS